MEKHLDDLSIFETYHDRQVILNYYQDEDFLWKRDGFFFKTIQLTRDSLLFLKENGASIQIPLKEFSLFTVNSDFQNYYFFRNGTNRLEIYFPL
jgi:hypothetical protein